MGHSTYDMPLAVYKKVGFWIFEILIFGRIRVHFRSKNGLFELKKNSGPSDRCMILKSLIKLLQGYTKKRRSSDL